MKKFNRENRRRSALSRREKDVVNWTKAVVKERDRTNVNEKELYRVAAKLSRAERDVEALKGKLQDRSNQVVYA